MNASEMDPNHALLVGSVYGALEQMRDTINDWTATEIEPVLDGKQLTNEFLVKRDSGSYRVTVGPVE